MANTIKAPEDRKQSRAVSATDKEWDRLAALAKAAGMGLSEYVIKKCKLDKD